MRVLRVQEFILRRAQEPGSRVIRVMRNNYQFLWLLSALLFTTSTVCAQETSTFTWEEFVEQFYTDIISDDYSGIYEGEIETNQLLLELQEIHDHPFNINTITKEQLSMLPFLNETQIEDILNYVSKNSPVLSLGELMLINSLDQTTRFRLMLFCYCGEAERHDKDRNTLGKLLRYSKNEVIFRTDIPFYTKAGYQDVADSILLQNPNKEYQGDKYYRSLRYSFSSLNQLDAGLQIEKDAGEKEFDYFSAYLMLRKLGPLKVLALGDYRISFGHGLVVNTSTSFGKLMSLSSIQSLDKGITKHSSLSENNFFRGAATTIAIRPNLNVSAFVSFKSQDATLLSDSSGMISTFKTDGLHRTMLEISKKNNTDNFTFGGNVRWETFSGRLRMGLTAIHSHLSRQLQPKCDTKSTLYKYYYPKGQDFSAYSLSYTYRNRKFVFSGESALNGNSNFASINTLQYRPDSYNSLTLIGRYYQAAYATLYGKSFGENSTPQNESGLFIGWNTTMISKVKIDTYFDLFYFPYLKYQISESSQGYDALVNLTYTPTTATSMSLRYRIKSKQKDFDYTVEDIDYTQLAYYTNQNIRFQVSSQINTHLNLRTTITQNFNYSPSGETTKGFAISQSGKWTGTILRLYSGTNKQSLSASIIYFNTDDYGSRVYSYESGLLYTFGMASYYYHGLRAVVSMSLPITKNVWVRAKWGMTKYFNRSTIGTNLEMINSDTKQDLNLQLGIKI